MNDQIIFVFAVIISIFGAIITVLDLFQTINLMIKNKDKKETKDKEINNTDIDPKLLEILLKENYVESIDKILDQCIKDAGDIFNIMILTPANISNNYSYITEQQQQEMSEYIFQSIMKTRMNDTLKKIISYTYKIDTEKELEDLIKLRIKIYMLNFITDYNSMTEN